MDDAEQTVGAPTDPDGTSPDGTDPDGDGPVPVPLLAVISAGGAVGACARYGASLVWPTMPGTFPWTTWAVNTAGCAAIGVLMVLITDVRTVHPLVRPFLGTGVLGGFTTFSTYALDAQRLVDGGRAGLALAYLALSVLVALGAVWAAATAMRWFVATTRRVAGRRA
ncbi:MULTISPECIES: fluoride efflux transporter FluC [unclassified Frankia]